MPKSQVLRWLIDPGPGVPEAVRYKLLARLLAGPGAMIVGVLNGIAVSVAGFCLTKAPVFALFIALDPLLGAMRVWVARLARQADLNGRAQPVSAYFALLIAWCGLQGIMSFEAMRSGSSALQVISATTVMAMVGPICARNFPAPRLTLLLICECHLPFVAGAVLSGEAWLLILAAQAPFFYYGAFRITWLYNEVATRALTAEQESSHRARHDPLTGLPNRLALEDLSDIPIDGIAILCLDLDGFKQVNDTFGHHVGDLLLQEVAHRLLAGVRAGDMAIRLGGDEFIVVAKALPPSVAGELADRLIERVAGESYALDGKSIRIGLSVGVACGPEDGRTFRELHQRSDAALYDAKACGKGVHRRCTELRHLPQRRWRSPENAI